MDVYILLLLSFGVVVLLTAWLPMVLREPFSATAGDALLQTPNPQSTRRSQMRGAAQRRVPFQGERAMDKDRERVIQAPEAASGPRDVQNSTGSPPPLAEATCSSD